ncbi:STAS-like domain-containing protein [Agrobacterium tumefaciens]|uniref:STAS-like domain-containing protein n=1 Tax=Agrobacterium tumefaciens TaxID=358 RepID=UPI000E0AF404|nr:STAS-like domain-containing protein [Agrobacterium tumefaciens]WQE40039.1 STAS-like domain-containing protein [Agrobacterium tumefaciens]
MEHVIEVAKDFTKYPGPRYRKSGPFSAEEFREKLLAPKLREAIQAGVKLIVVLDDVAGYGSSFLDESFAGLVRDGFDMATLMRHLEIRANTPRFRHHAVRANEYISEEALRSETALH